MIITETWLSDSILSEVVSISRSIFVRKDRKEMIKIPESYAVDWMCKYIEASICEKQYGGVPRSSAVFFTRSRFA